MSMIREIQKRLEEPCEEQGRIDRFNAILDFIRSQPEGGREGGLWHIAEAMCSDGDAEFGLFLLRHVSAPNRLEYYRQKKRALRRLKRFGRFLLSYGLFHAFFLISEPAQYSRLIRAKIFPFVSRNFLQKRARKILEASLGELKKRLSGKRVLILGAGPSAKDISSVPDDVIVIGVNRSPVLLQHWSRPPARLFWMVTWAMPSRGYWDQFLEILQSIEKVELFQFNFSYTDCVWKVGPKHWAPFIDPVEKIRDHIFLPWDYNEPLSDLGLDPEKYRSTCFSTGFVALMFALVSRPREVYIAGLDLGYAGREKSDYVYAFPKDRFRLTTGEPLQSNQHIKHSMDEEFLADLAKANLPLYCVSEKSRAADYLPVRPIANDEPVADGESVS